MDLFESATDGEVVRLRNANRLGIDLKREVGINGCSLLHAACTKMGGNLRVVKYLCNEIGIDVNCIQNDGKSPLHIAGYFGHIECVRFLCEETKACVNKIDFEGYSVLHVTCSGGSVECVQYLCEKARANVDLCGKVGETILHTASKAGNLGCVMYLVDDMKLYANEKDDEHNTALHYASFHGQDRVVSFLLTLGGINVRITNKDRKTAEDLARNEPVRRAFREYRERLRMMEEESERKPLEESIRERIEEERRQREREMKRNREMELLQIVAKLRSENTRLCEELDAKQAENAALKTQVEQLKGYENRKGMEIEINGGGFEQQHQYGGKWDKGAGGDRVKIKGGIVRQQKEEKRGKSGIDRMEVLAKFQEFISALKEGKPFKFNLHEFLESLQ